MLHIKITGWDYTTGKKRIFRKDTPENPIIICRTNKYSGLPVTGVMVRNSHYFKAESKGEHPIFRLYEDAKFVKEHKKKGVDLYFPNSPGIDREYILRISRSLKEQSGEQICLYCGRTFPVLRSDAKTCSGRCRTAISRLGKNPEKLASHFNSLGKKIHKRIGNR